MQILSLNGKWKCKPDLNNEGVEGKWYNPKIYNENAKELINIEIPMSFNSLEGFEVYEGIFWHFLIFNIDNSDLKENKVYYIKFKGANYNSKVWLNNEFLGTHDGGFVPFRFAINTPLNQQKNL